jgi:hypothetical protein
VLPALRWVFTFMTYPPVRMWMVMVTSLFYTITGHNTSHRGGGRPAKPRRSVAETPGLNQMEHHVPELMAEVKFCNVDSETGFGTVGSLIFAGSDGMKT